MKHTKQMDRSWINSRLFSKAHLDGINEFMNFISERFDENVEILCPCRKCLNRVHRHKGHVEDHLYIHGMASTYTKWIHHGEPSDARINENEDNLDEHNVFNEDVDMNVDEEDNPDDRIPAMLEELYTAEDQGGGKSMFAAILEEMKQELYPGANYTRFSFVVKLLHIKSFYRISNVAFTALLKLLSSAFPACSLPASYHEAKKLIRALGLGYDSIHVCPNNCVLFRKEYAKNDKCPVCDASRWKDADGRKQIPQKVLRHFPLIPRLKRMFASKKIAEAAQWHKLKRKPVENELSHPADGEAWKEFDRKYGWFAKDARNIRLGLATDGFNPFGKMSSSYSMWPVFLIPYNFPPWECMEQSNFMMGLLIPGPECPRKDFDVFLEPLIEELLELSKGVRTFDAFNGTMFDLHAAVIWCIHDYPALSTLSGRVTRGYYACVRCDKNPCSRRIRNKICYIGHRRFLARDHPWRMKKDFDGKPENLDKPEEFSIDELMQQLDRVKDVRPGKHPQSKKRKREEEGQCWKRRSCLWDLPYWTSLKLRHNLDVMHIEKNICDNILATFLGIVGKSKDTINARLDLEDMGIRKHLHLKSDGDSYSVPHAPYTMNKTQKLAFCDFLRSVKFPDGYASNLATCITADGCNLQGLKTHDCHILLQRILPAAVRGIMHKDIYEALAELEVAPVGYEKVRAQTMMRNNQVLQSLGISALTSILTKSNVNSKGSAREDSGSLYEPEVNEDIEHGVVDKVSENVNRKSMTRNINMPSGGRRVSKRVMANDEHDQAAKMTRQRTRELCSTEDGTTTNPKDGSTKDALVATNSPTPDDQILMRNEGEPNAMIDRWNRGRTMGRDLDRISRGLCTKIPVHIAEGKRRPEAPLQAAKLASEGGIILRQHIPIFPHWKEYKKDKSQLKDYMDKVAGQFTIDTDSKPVKEACADLLKCGQRQMRYQLKKTYFNNVPANQVRTTSPLKSMTDEQWKALVEMWSNPKHKDKCVKNKLNRENVRYQQRTGSRSYIAHCHVVKQTKYKDVPPTAIDLFKECHCSSKTGFSEPVKNLIADMEAIIADPAQEGQAPKTHSEVVSQVLPKSKFLQNVGLESVAPKRSSKAVVAARVEELEAELEAEKQCAADLRDTLDGQQDELDSLKKKVDESEAARKQQLEEIENLKKSSEETNALIRRLISFNTPSFSQP